jgi:hypothetical protein
MQHVASCFTKSIDGAGLEGGKEVQLFGDGGRKQETVRVVRVNPPSNGALGMGW